MATRGGRTSRRGAEDPIAVAEADGPRQLRLTYNNPVNRSGVPARIVAIREDITADSVRATFQTAGLPDVTADPTALVRVVDTGAPVITDDPDRLGSLPATVAAGTPKNAPGFTNGPDLLASAYDRRAAGCSTCSTRTSVAPTAPGSS